jgi:hypothetical protein
MPISSLLTALVFLESTVWTDTRSRTVEAVLSSSPLVCWTCEVLATVMRFHDRWLNRTVLFESDQRGHCG